MLPDSHILARVTATVRLVDEAQVLQLASGLLQGTLELSAGPLEVQQYLRTNIIGTGAIVGLLRHWQQSGWTAENLGIAVMSASTGYSVAAAERPEVNVVWTGPALASIRARSTAGILIELIENAQSELIIVGYALTDGAAAIFEALVAAQQRRIRVIIAGNQLEHSLHILRSHWPYNHSLPELYTRPQSPVDMKSALHAKLAIADSRRMLVTSANLTYHGLEGNIEFGLVVTGKPVSDVVELLRALIAAEELVPVAIR